MLDDAGKGFEDISSGDGLMRFGVAQRPARVSDLSVFCVPTQPIEDERARRAPPAPLTLIVRMIQSGSGGRFLGSPGGVSDAALS